MAKRQVDLTIPAKAEPEKPAAEPEKPKPKRKRGKAKAILSPREAAISAIGKLVEVVDGKEIDETSKELALGILCGVRKVIREIESDMADAAADYDDMPGVYDELRVFGAEGTIRPKSLDLFSE